MSQSIDLGDQVAISAVVSYAIELLKRWDKFSLLSQNTDKLNRLIAWSLNVVLQLGIGFAWSGTLITGGTLTITIPSVWTIWDLAKGLAVQELAYRGAVKQK